jgi:hypothetical protein
MIRGGAGMGRQAASPLRHVRPPLGGSALITAHQIDLFRSRRHSLGCSLGSSG